MINWLGLINLIIPFIVLITGLKSGVFFLVTGVGTQIIITSVFLILSKLLKTKNFLCIKFLNFY